MVMAGKACDKKRKVYASVLRSVCTQKQPEVQSMCCLVDCLSRAAQSCLSISAGIVV